MNNRLRPVSILFFTGILLFHSSPSAYAEPDINLLGVSVGDSFTFVLDRYVGIDDTYQIAYNSSTEIWLEIKEKDEFTITITNIDVVLHGKFYLISSQYSNATYSIIANLAVNTDGFVAFLDWDYYSSTLTADFSEGMSNGQVTSYEVINGEDEFKWFANFTSPFTPDLYEYVEVRYNKTTGVQLYKYRESVLYEGRFKFILRQKVEKSLISEGDSDAFLPGFQSYLSILALFVTIIALRRKK